MVQWHYNLDTKVAEVAYFSDPLGMRASLLENQNDEASPSPAPTTQAGAALLEYCILTGRGLDNSTGGSGESSDQ